MNADPAAFHAALTARDTRFDGVFFVGVTSTGVYCRPICPAKTPRAANCRFFSTAAEAEVEGFRPCLRCRPELAPGNAPVDDAQRIAQLIVERLEEGQLGDGRGLEAIASQFDLSSRQIRRIVQNELRVSPIQLLLTRRLLLAKQLLTETGLPVTDVAFASGFASLRRFNDAFARRYGMPPTRLRRTVADEVTLAAGHETSRLHLSFRAPYAWAEMLAFLAARAISGVEAVNGDSYARTVRMGSVTGWIRVRMATTQKSLELEFTHSLAPVLPALLARVRSLFDLHANPQMIDAHLGAHTHLASSVRAHPGLRVPGAFDGFETAVRAVIGQQVTVKGATTLAGRFARVCGDPIATPIATLDRVTPDATRIASLQIDDIARHGIVADRCRSIVALARAHASGDLRLDGNARHNPDESIVRLMTLPGIGPWTAQYIAMRVLQWPDAFPKEDIALRKALGGVAASEAARLSQLWRPWRSYAVMHLWRMATGVR